MKEKALGERVFTGIPPRQWEKGNTLKEAHGGWQVNGPKVAKFLDR
jgi:hypothetical protein